MNYSFYIARRLSFSDREGKSLPAVKVAVAAVAFSVAVMIASVSIVLGFKNEIMEKITGFNPDITVYLAESESQANNTLTLTPTLLSVIEETPGVVSVDQSLSMPAVFKTSDDFKGIYLRNVATPRLQTFLKKSLEEGRLPDYTDSASKNKILISRLTADHLGLKTGDRIDTYFITDAIRIRRLEIAGIYRSHFDAYDEVYVFGSLDMLKELQGLREKEATALHLNVDKFDNVAATTMLLDRNLAMKTADGTLNHVYATETILTSAGGYLNWLALLDTNVVVIIILMLVIGCVTLVSGMLIILLDKKRIIGILKSIGMPDKKLRGVFVYLAMRVAATGVIIGDVLAAAILYAQDKWHFLKLDADSYYIDFVPVDLNPWWILLISAGVFVGSYIVLLIPSRMVAKISPAETIRDEG